MDTQDRVKELLKEINLSFSNLLGDNLIGIYVHGSLAMGCFNSKSSDIDVLVVVNNPLTLAEKKKSVDLTLKLAKQTFSGLEFSVLTLKQVRNFEYPTPYEFHYSNEWKEKYIQGKVDLIKQKYDHDLAVHFVITKNRGYVLVGKPINEVFIDVPRKYYIDSIGRDSEWSYNNIMKGPDDGLCCVPVYGALNYCRVLAYIENNLITSKSEAGKWAVEHLPKKYAPIIQEALKEYSKSGSSNDVSAALLKQFARLCKSRINKYVS